jgi:hypothetical protein
MLRSAGKSEDAKTSRRVTLLTGILPKTNLIQ